MSELHQITHDSPKRTGEILPLVPPRFAPHVFWRIYIFLTGVLGPAACFVASMWGVSPIFDEPWQSGQTRDYIAVLLSWPTSIWFQLQVLPLALALSCLVFRPQSVANAWVRWGVYWGFLSSFLILMTLVMANNLLHFIGGVLGFLIFYLPLTALVWYGFRLYRRLTIQRLLLVTFLVALTISVFSFVLREVALYGLIGLLAGTPLLCVLTYFVVSGLIWRTMDQEQISWQQTLSGTAMGVILTGVTWRQALITMLDEYTKLPTTDPNCFVCSAAAHGDAWLVGARTCESGERRWKVNSQMQYLKLLELLLAAVSPRIQRCVRAVYNRWGPCAAHWIRRQRWRANAAYLLLVPVMWVAQCLCWILRIPRERIQSIYCR